jgi:multidrug resistance efflux pump
LQEQTSRSSAWSLVDPEDFTLPRWYFNKDEAMQAAQAELQTAQAALEVEQENYATVSGEIGEEELAEANARLAQAQAAYLTAQEILARAQGQENQLLQDYAQADFDNAQAELLSSQEAYDVLLPEQAQAEVLQARARLALAQERYDTAQDHYNRLLTGDESLQVKMAEMTVQQAQAALDLVDAQIGQEQAAQAQAQTQLDLVDTQIKRLLVSASVPGVILNRNIEPGEMVQPGSVALNIGQLDDLTITVFIPEDRYGEIDLGMPARVAPIHFLANFDAVVTHIADQAEFTPRNVQTEEGRRSTVYAIKLSVDSPAGKLKPGMPADVTFEE